MEELDDIISLLRKYLAGNLTALERERLEEWSVQHPANKALLESISDEATLFAGYTDYLQVYGEAVSDRLQRIGDTLMESVNVSTGRNYSKQRPFRWLPYAAAILLAATAAVWVMFGERTANQTTAIVNTGDIQPGGNRATLTLSDGRNIGLSERQTGIIVGEKITYADGSAVIENEQLSMDSDGGQGNAISTISYQLSTPKGGTYQVTLPDGTRVWLNAASTLKYPSQFADEERLVELVGEAYFAVKRDAKRPFKVSTRNQEIEVLGTEFNIMAYEDDLETRTTLVEGSVRLNAKGTGLSLSLLPGEQGVWAANRLTKDEVDVVSYTAWKDGRFHFAHTPFDEMVKQVARWYDVEVVYQRGVPQESFTGKMGRDLTLNAMLDLLDISDADIWLEGRKMIVKQKISEK